MQSIISHYLVISLQSSERPSDFEGKVEGGFSDLRFSEGTFTPVVFLSVLPHIHDSGSVDFLTFLSLSFRVSSLLFPLVIILSFRFFSY